MRPAARSRRPARASVSSDALHDEQRQRAAGARVDDPLRVADASRPGPGSNTYSTVTRPASTAARSAETSAASASSPDLPPAKPDRARAVDVRRVDRRDVELAAGRLRLRLIAPADADRVRLARAASRRAAGTGTALRATRAPRAGTARRRDSPCRPRRGDRQTSTVDVAPRDRRLQRAAASRSSGCAQAVGRPRSSGSRSGRCRTSSSR